MLDELGVDGGCACIFKFPFHACILSNSMWPVFWVIGILHGTCISH
jgi:hypothetical protein